MFRLAPHLVSSSVNVWVVQDKANLFQYVFPVTHNIKAKRSLLKHREKHCKNHIKETKTHDYLKNNFKFCWIIKDESFLQIICYDFNIE